jgi:hypothetical protein
MNVYILHVLKPKACAYVPWVFETEAELAAALSLAEGRGYQVRAHTEYVNSFEEFKSWMNGK